LFGFATANRQWLRVSLGSPICPFAAVRSQGGHLSWWKKKEDAAGGAPPQKGARLKLSEYSLEVGAAPEGKYFCFAIVAKGAKSNTG